ncbi:MAG: cysteine dioxygenase, partial [Janthinobacterium lividum]
MTHPDSVERLRGFVVDFSRLVTEETRTAVLLQRGADLLGALVARDNWLPDAYAVPHPEHYQQYLL